MLQTFANGWDAAPAARERLEIDRAVDDIRRRFGHYSIARAVMSTDPTLRQFDAKSDHSIRPVGYFS